RSLSCCRIGGNLLHKQNRQGCVRQALTPRRRLGPKSESPATEGLRTPPPVRADYGITAEQEQAY
ncbi:hypothetical protein ACXIUT_25130, partial [Achromobacter denitrificans]